MLQHNLLQDQKKKLRRVLLEKRHDAYTDSKKNALLNIRVSTLLENMNVVRTIGLYWPIRDEFDVRPAALDWCIASQERCIALPVIREPNVPLEFHIWNSFTPIRQGHHRIVEPDSNEIVIPDLVLIPCIGFDLKNYRLGYGGGYYDRTLSAWKGEVKPITVGLAYETCKVDALPIESHDHALNLIVTEKEVYTTMVISN